MIIYLSHFFKYLKVNPFEQEVSSYISENNLNNIIFNDQWNSFILSMLKQEPQTDILPKLMSKFGKPSNAFATNCFMLVINFVRNEYFSTQILRNILFLRDNFDFQIPISDRNYLFSLFYNDIENELLSDVILNILSDLNLNELEDFVSEITEKHFFTDSSNLVRFVKRSKYISNLEGIWFEQFVLYLQHGKHIKHTVDKIFLLIELDYERLSRLQFILSSFKSDDFTNQELDELCILVGTNLDKITNTDGVVIDEVQSVLDLVNSYSGTQALQMDYKLLNEKELNDLCIEVGSICLYHNSQLTFKLVSILLKNDLLSHDDANNLLIGLLKRDFYNDHFLDELCSYITKFSSEDVSNFTTIFLELFEELDERRLIVAKKLLLSNFHFSSFYLNLCLRFYLESPYDLKRKEFSGL